MAGVCAPAYFLNMKEFTMSETEPVGPTCLYKDGESKTLEGESVASAEKDGWKDAPAKKRGPKPKIESED